jgi:hypothetical protein
MHNRIRVIMTQKGMNHLRLGITLGYLISAKDERVYILEDNKKTIVSYHRDFWKAYHEEENF